MSYVERALVADSNAINPYARKAHFAMMVGGDRALARETARQIIFRFGAERAVTSDAIGGLIPTLDTIDLVTLEQVSLSSFGGNRVLYYYWRAVLFQDWRPDRARAYADSVILAGGDLIKDESDYRVHAAVGWLNAVRGRPTEAVREARRSLQLMPISRDFLVWSEMAQWAARTYIRAGQPDLAIDQIEQLLKVHSMITIPYLRTDPLFAPLRGNPRFERLLARSS